MNRIFLFLLLTFAGTSVFSQNTQKDLEEMQKKLQKMRDSVLNDPNVRKYMSNANATTTNTLPSSTTASRRLPAGSPDEKKFEKIKLPPKDSAKIKAIPNKTFSLSELHSYLDNLYALLSKRFPADAVASANAIATKLNNIPTKLEATALVAWQNGASEEAMLLITKGAIVSGDDDLLLTNAGAILEMNGFGDKAIPILRTVVHYDPQNVIALNNLGQAFTALGLEDSALYYFSRCLSLSPQHPEANNTAGMIELARGNKQKAQTCFENSIRGGYTPSAYGGLHSILKDKCRIRDLVKPKVKFPEYFNQFRYKLPRQCRRVEEAAEVEEEEKAFREMISRSLQLYGKLEREAEKAVASKDPMKMNQEILNKASKGESYMRPFQLMAATIEAEAIVDYQRDFNDLQPFNTNNRRQYEELEQQYQKAYEALRKKYEDQDDEACCGEGNTSCCNSNFCKEANALKNNYLVQFAQLNEEWQSRNLQVELKYFDDLIYWSYFSAIDLDDYRVRFYGRVVNYLRTLSRLDLVKILEPCRVEKPEAVKKPEQKELKEFDCPFDIEFPFVVGKITLSCEKFSFKAGEGLVFKYEKKFTGSKQSTITLGAGGGIDASFKLGGIKAGAEAGMNMSVFLTFDGEGNCTDGGMMYSASRGLGIDFSAGEKVKIKRDLTYVGEEMSWRFGINSGASFNMPDTPFKEEKEKPLNKNVKIYKPAN